MSMLFRWLQRFAAIIAAFTALLGVKQTTVTVSLYANPSSGYSWECSFDRQGVMTLSDSYYKQNLTLFSDDTKDGKQYFILKSIGEGTVNVRFKYVNSRGYVASSYTYRYSVSDTGRITLISKT